jgi:hypothetical protein
MLGPATLGAASAGHSVGMHCLESASVLPRPARTDSYHVWLAARVNKTASPNAHAATHVGFAKVEKQIRSIVEAVKASLSGPANEGRADGDRGAQGPRSAIQTIRARRRGREVAIRLVDCVRQAVPALREKKAPGFLKPGAWR